MPRKFHIVTYGCQMNKCDSEVLASILDEHGYLYTENLQDADIVLLNTCSVRDTAERKVIGRLGRLKHLKQKRPDMIVGVCGCMAQSWGRQLADEFPHVDIVLGTNRLAELPRLIRKSQELGSVALGSPSQALESPRTRGSEQRGKTGASAPVARKSELWKCCLPAKENKSKYYIRFTKKGGYVTRELVSYLAFL